jgi:peptidoglycan/xylan/chitin deacetylase (PgdA/CDA1 family)
MVHFSSLFPKSQIKANLGRDGVDSLGEHGAAARRNGMTKVAIGKGHRLQNQISRPAYRYLTAFWAIIFLFYSAGSCSADATVFIYHRFGEDVYPTTSVPVDSFRRQMAYLRDEGYRVVPLQEIVDAVRNRRPISDKTVAITIDDGYSSTYTVAWPVLKRYGYPFTVFLYLKAVDKDYRNILTWKQIREMAAAGVDFQDHSYGHERFGSRPQGLDDESYKAWVKQDLALSNALFEKKLQRKPEMLAFPYGEYNSIVLAAAGEMGYVATFSQDPGAISADSDIHSLPREPILGSEWSTLKHFKEVLERKDLPITDLQPDLSPLVNPAPKRFGARLLYPDRYVPDSFGIYVSELGWKKASFNDGRVYIDNHASLSRRQNRIMISAREKGTNRTALRFWLVIADR